MPDRAESSAAASPPRGWHRWLRLLGALLPARLREVVFEPACYDMVRATLESRGDTRLLGPRLVGVLLQVSVLNLPRIWIDHRRPSRLALLVVGALGAMLLALVTLAIAMAPAYA